MTTDIATLGELVACCGGAVRTGPFGSQLHKHDYVVDDDAIPVVMPKDMKDGRVDTKSIARVDRKTVERLRQHILASGDIVLARRGDIGRRAWVGDPEAGWLCGTGSMRISLRDCPRVRSRYLYYYLETPKAVGWLEGHSVGATMSNLSAGVVEELPVEFPPVDVQDKVIGVLDSIGSLVDNNRRRIKLLAAFASRLYREWFVQLRFPNHEGVAAQQSSDGPVPKGWQRANLFDLADVGFGFSFKSQGFGDEGEFPVVRIRDIPANTTTTYTDEIAGERYEIHDGDSLIGMDGEFHMCRWADGLAYLNQRVARVRASGPLTQYHLHLALEEPIRRFNASITGTTVAHLGKRHLEEISLLVPPGAVLRAANAFFDPALDLEINLRKQNRALERARGLLLPRLVSGELGTSDLDIDMAVVG